MSSGDPRLGLGTIVYARPASPAADASPPTIDDHWHVAYGFSLCDTESSSSSTAPWRRSTPTASWSTHDFLRTGVHSHDDGVIHWHPFTSAAVGKQRHARRVPRQLRRRARRRLAEFPDEPEAARSTSRARRSARTARTASCRSSCGRAPTTPSDGRRYVSGLRRHPHRQEQPGVHDRLRSPRAPTSAMPPWAPSCPSSGAVDQGQTEPTVHRRRRRLDARRAPRAPAPTTPDARRVDRRHRRRRRTTTAAATDHHRRLMRAVVLVGGFGTRLRPLTNTVPKSMLPVAHVPLIVRLIGQLERGRRRRRHAGARVPARAVRRGLPRRPLRRRRARLRHRARAARHRRGDPLRRRPRRHRRHVRRRQRRRAHRPRRRRPRRRPPGGRGRGDDPPHPGRRPVGVRRRRASTTTVASRRFVEKPPPGTEPSNLINAGTYVFEPSVLDRIPPGRRCRSSATRSPLVAAGGRFHAMATDDYWIDAGRPELYLRANLDLVDGRRAETCDAVAPTTPSSHRRRHRRRRAWSGPVHASVRGRRSPVRCCCPAPIVGPGAVVEDSIVAGAVGDGARGRSLRGRRRRHDSRR